jgi:hypothetical protein
MDGYCPGTSRAVRPGSMRHKSAYLGSGLFLATMAVSCSSNDPSTSPDAAVTMQTCELTAPLTCASMTLCSNSTVKAFQGELPSPAGGRISVGAYRLGYVLYPSGSGADIRDELPEELAFGTSDFLHIAADPSALQSGLGSYTSSGSSLTLSFATGCSGNGTPPSAFGTCGTVDAVPISAFTTTLHYTADTDTISIFRDAQGGSPAMYVYYVMVDVTGSVRDACASVASAPQAPGDSLQCTSSAFCTCLHHEEIAVHCQSSSSSSN